MHPLSQAERDAEIEWFREELAAVNEATIAARAENKAARAQSEAVIRQIEGLSTSPRASLCTASS